MANDLHARLLTEIEWRERAERATFPPSDDDLDRYSEVLAYLAALRGVVELHRPDGHGDCWTCSGSTYTRGEHPCDTASAVATALGVSV